MELHVYGVLYEYAMQIYVLQRPVNACSVTLVQLKKQYKCVFRLYCLVAYQCHDVILRHLVEANPVRPHIKLLLSIVFIVTSRHVIDVEANKHASQQTKHLRSCEVS